MSISIQAHPLPSKCCPLWWSASFPHSYCGTEREWCTKIILCGPCFISIFHLNYILLTNTRDVTGFKHKKPKDLSQACKTDIFSLDELQQLETKGFPSQSFGLLLGCISWRNKPSSWARHLGCSPPSAKAATCFYRLQSVWHFPRGGLAELLPV